MAEMSLGLFLRPTGHHVAAWRHPEANADGSFQHFAEMAKIAEAACFDLLFCADIATLWEGSNESLCRLGTIARIDPCTLLSGLGAVTTHIGLVCTASTTYDEPFHVARRFASLDYATGGRAGWNLVTSAHEAEARNFSREMHLPKLERQGIRFRRSRAVGQLGARRIPTRQGECAFLRSIKAPCAQSQGRVLQRSGPAERSSVTSASPDHGSGWRI